MKQILGVFIICLWGSRFGLAQTTYSTQDTAYVHAVEQGLAYLKKGDCESCLDSYKKAFTISQKSALSTMRAALCAYVCKQIELSKKYIRQAIDIDYDITEEVWIDQQVSPEFDVVRGTSMNNYVQAEFSRKDTSLHINQSLKKELAAIFVADQQPRSQIDSIRRVYGQDSPEMKQLWQRVHQSDSINLIKIEKIIQQHSYPGKSLVGSMQSNTAWLVIQHSPLLIQEKYLPLMEAAVIKNEMPKSSLALLIDRIRMYKGQKQLYGSQVTINSNGKNEFHPIEDEANVNKRRAAMELGSIEDYARQNGFEHTPAH